MTGETRRRNWFYLPREYRAMLVANEQLNGLTMQIEAHEDRAKRNNK
jgi:hypothetical protein